jgi:transposase
MKERRKYDEKFKEDAVNLLISTGKGICETARDLGIPESCLGRWRQAQLKKLDGDIQELGGTERLPSDIEKENRQLRKELADAIQQREILKKAIGIFSRTPDKYMGS